MREHGKRLPEILDKIAIVREYNSMTGANLSHWDLNELGIFEHDEVVFAIENRDLLG